MSAKYKIAAIATLFASASLIVACSSSTSSSSGRGQIPTGQYTGNLNGQVGSNNSAAVPTSTRIILNVVAQLGTPPSTNGQSTGTVITGISGNMAVTGGDRCWSGGTINGTGGGTNPNPNPNPDPDPDPDPDPTANGDQDDTDSALIVKKTGEFLVHVFISEAQAQSVINGDQMTLEISTIQGTLNMTGRVTDDSYSGTFSTTNSDCGPISGGFDLDRV